MLVFEDALGGFVGWVGGRGEGRWEEVGRKHGFGGKVEGEWMERSKMGEVSPSAQLTSSTSSSEAPNSHDSLDDTSPAALNILR